MFESEDERQIAQLFEDGDRALISVNPAQLNRIYADDYVQYDESGRIRTKQDLIRALRDGKLRFIAMKSTGRNIRLFGDFAVVHGSEQDEIEQAGQRLIVSYMYMDVVVRRGEEWQIVASQLAKLESSE